MSDPVLVSIAAALAGKAVGSLYDLVKTRFGNKGKAATALEAAKGTEPDSPEVHALAAELAETEAADPVFRAELRAEWTSVSVRQHAEGGGVNNQVSGTVSGNVVQLGDVSGGITFN